MKIIWDEPKRQTVLNKRGYDLADIDEAFLDAARIEPGHSGRMKAIGRYRGQMVTVIYEPLGTEAVSLVTMRRATKKERRGDD